MQRLKETYSRQKEQRKELRVYLRDKMRDRKLWLRNMSKRNMSKD
jgi:hypothetical protein